MANFFEGIKMANFCVLKIANFFYQNGEFFDDQNLGLLSHNQNDIYLVLNNLLFWY